MGLSYQGESISKKSDHRRKLDSWPERRKNDLRMGDRRKTQKAGICRRVRVRGGERVRLGREI